MSLESLFNKAWYGDSKWTYLLSPLSPLVSFIVKRKRETYLATADTRNHFDVPVLVVGNLTVGGTGKSPMVLALIKVLRQAGYKPGIVSRGYGVNAKVPVLVDSHSIAAECGDEPVMLARRAQCPLVICQNRVSAVQHLLELGDVDIVISDDGMQHYAMARDIEVLMLDSKRGLGNGCLLPVGPLREPVTRLQDVDYVVGLISANASFHHDEQALGLKKLLSKYPESVELEADKIYAMPLMAGELINLKTGEASPISMLKSQRDWQVVAGIGNPERFLNTLIQQGISPDYQTHWFADHHQFTVDDIKHDKPVVMTEKDAVKCKDLSITNHNVWYLPVEVTLEEDFVHSLIEKIQQIKAAKLSIGK